MKVLSVSTNPYYNLQFNGRKKKRIENESNCNPQYSRSYDALRRQLMNLAVASMMMAGTTLTSSCVTEPPDYGDMYSTQCPKVVLPVRSMDGFLPKADYMMQLLGLLPKDASLLDVDNIQIIDKSTGNMILMEPREESNEDKVIMDYTLIKPNGDEAYSTYEMYDNGYGYITCLLNESEGIAGSYKRFTQSTTDLNNLAEFTMINNVLCQSGIIKRTKDGYIKHINPANKATYYKVNVELK